MARTSKLMALGDVACLCEGLILLIHLVYGCFHEHEDVDVLKKRLHFLGLPATVMLVSKLGVCRLSSGKVRDNRSRTGGNPV